jgi:hypothetical protein
MHSPQQVSSAPKGERVGYPGQPEKASESMAGSSPANSLQKSNVGFADILALLGWKTIGESGCRAAGARMQGSRRRGKLRYTTLQSSAAPEQRLARAVSGRGGRRGKAQKNKPDG